VRRLRRLVQKRTLRWSEGVCVLEGPDLVEAAIDAGVEFEALYVDVAAKADSSAIIERATRAGIRVFALSPGVIERVADARTPQPVMAAVRFTGAPLASIGEGGPVVVLHDVKDPGNAGTIVRSADALGASAVVFTGDSVDPYNPKTLRATAGSIFHLPVVVSDLDSTLEYFTSRHVDTFATVVRGGEPLSEVDLRGAAAVVVGNESAGLDRASAAKCSRRLTIPMSGRSESLNAGVAASLILYEALRQRGGANPGASRPSL
jgi:RNA methyltransferase, TrmH family